MFSCFVRAIVGLCCLFAVVHAQNAETLSARDREEKGMRGKRCDKAALKACSKLILGGPECEDCVKGLNVGCTSEQTDKLCWATSDPLVDDEDTPGSSDGIYHSDHAFEAATEAAYESDISVVVMGGIAAVFLLVGFALLQSLKGGSGVV